MTGSRKLGLTTLLGLLVLGGTVPLASQEKGKDAERKPATLLLRVPADAQLEINGVAFKQTGEQRRFETPPLAPGSHSYIIKIILNSGGAA